MQQPDDRNRWRIFLRLTLRDRNGSTDLTLGRPAGAVAIALIAAIIPDRVAAVAHYLLQAVQPAVHTLLKVLGLT